jgi:hypothetical protein
VVTEFPRHKLGFITHLSLRLTLPWFDQICSGKNCADKDADTANDNVGDAHEVVFPTHHCPGRDIDRFCATIFGNIES